MARIYEMENLHVDEENFNAVCFNIVGFEVNDEGKKIGNSPISEAKFVVDCVQLTDDGWIKINANNFKRFGDDIAEQIQNLMNEAWTDDVIEKKQDQLEKAFVLKHIRFNSARGSITQEELMSILSLDQETPNE